MTEKMTESLLRHAQQHPAAQLVDMVKFIYQSVLGGGHLITDEQAALERLKAEIAGLVNEQLSQPYIEPLGGGYCRMNLSACSEASPELMNRLFVQSAKAVTEDDLKRFDEQTAVLKELCTQQPTTFNFTADDVERYLAEYSLTGYAPVSHSLIYHEEYKPSYRVITEDLARLLPLFVEVEKRLALGKPVTVAIDGHCGSGKSTAAAHFGEIFDCNVFHADDYYLPLEKRTPERLAEIGGNMERERLETEILQNLKSGSELTYTPFVCAVMSPGEPVTVNPKQLNVVEGSYSMHPDLRKYYDISAFFTIEPDEQLARIEKRESKQGLEGFITKWIPKENAYFKAMQVKEACDFVL